MFFNERIQSHRNLGFKRLKGFISVNDLSAEHLRGKVIFFCKRVSVDSIGRFSPLKWADCCAKCWNRSVLHLQCDSQRLTANSLLLLSYSEGFYSFDFELSWIMSLVICYRGEKSWIYNSFWKINTKLRLWMYGTVVLKSLNNSNQQQELTKGSLDVSDKKVHLE